MILILISLAALLLPPSPASQVRVTREALLMGTSLRIELVARTRAEGIEAIGAAFDQVARLEAKLSTWRDDSEVAALNRAPPGVPVALSEELYTLLREAAAWTDSTGGAFDPAIGALVDAWDLRGAGREPQAETLAAARALTGLHRFVFDDSRRTVARPADGAWLDTGGFGKGVALRLAGAVLRSRGISSASLNFGGQVLALGAGETRSGWETAVAHPSRRAEPVMRLRLRDRSASTSAQSERFVAVGGRRYGHIVDPRTGRPVPAWGSVTAVAEDPGVADIVSTALLVLGPEEGTRWAEGRNDIGVLFLIERAGRVEPWWNRALERHLIVDSTLTQGG